MSSTHETVPPAEPIAPWLGGKRLLASRIIQRIDAVEHRCYAEPFCGMAGVFLRRTKRPPAEAINDINGEIVNLFRCVREHPDELDRQFRWTLAARGDFRRLLETPPEILTDIQRAARFAFLQRLTFGGKPSHTRPGMNLGAHYPARFTAPHMGRLIRRAHKRLQRANIDCLDWPTFIARYDKPFTLFYIDPPYWGHERDYGKGVFGREDFGRMAELLAGIRGRFILSLNDRSEVRQLFGRFDVQEVKTRYSANAKAAREAGELLISN